jgi:hypothetical protein
MWGATYPLYVVRSVHIDNQFTTIKQNAETFSLYIYITVSHWVILHASIHKGPSWRNQTKSITLKSNWSLYTADMLYKIQIVKI